MARKQTTAYVHKDGVAQVSFFGLGVPAEAPQVGIEPAEEEHALNSTFDDTEVEAALDALGEKVNAILQVLETFGFLLPFEEEES